MIATRQYGLVTRAQVLAAGGSDAWLVWAQRDGRLRRVRHGVYAVVGSPPEHQALMAACLAAAPSAAASHLAAVSYYGAEQVKGGRLEVTTFDNHQHRLPGVIMHRSRIEPARAISAYFTLPVVVPALAVVQVAETSHPFLVKSIANDLVKRRWTTFREILYWVEVSDGRGRKALRELCLRAIEVGGHDDSPAARDLCAGLQQEGFAPFEVDYQVVNPEGIVLIDIAWPWDQLGLEYNGRRDHDGPLARAADDRRRNCLVAMGWRILDADRGMTQQQIIGWVRAALAATRAS